MYQSRIVELREQYGEYREIDAARFFERYLEGISTDNLLELSYWDKRRMHNLKYFTWIEQQGKDVEELNEQWYSENYWQDRLGSFKAWDKLIKGFNEQVGLIDKYK